MLALVALRMTLTKFFMYLQSAAQVSYIDWFMKHGRFNEAEDLFKRYLRGSPMVDLWRFYLQYVL